MGEHQAQPLTAELIEDFDLVVVMEAQQLKQLRTTFPGYSGRIVLLPLYASSTGYRQLNIADPYGKARDAFETCFDEIETALTGLARLLVREEVCARQENS